MGGWGSVVRAACSSALEGSGVGAIARGVDSYAGAAFGDMMGISVWGGGLKADGIFRCGLLPAFAAFFIVIPEAVF